MSTYSGHKTLMDGTRVPLAPEDAKALWAEAEAGRQKLAIDMPSARDALTAINAAHSRMNALGWSLGPGLGVRRGDECAVAQSGSTGIWRGRVDDEGRYVQFGDCVADPRKCWLKPIADLTDDERAWMQECDQREAAAYSAMIQRLAEIEETP